MESFQRNDTTINHSFSNSDVVTSLYWMAFSLCRIGEVIQSLLVFGKVFSKFRLVANPSLHFTYYQLLVYINYKLIRKIKTL